MGGSAERAALQGLQGRLSGEGEETAIDGIRTMQFKKL